MEALVGVEQARVEKENRVGPCAGSSEGTELSR